MELKQLAVRFTETAAEEIDHLVRELRLVPLAGYLSNNNMPVPKELKADLVTLLSILSDLFSVDLPDIEKNPEQALRTISRDINLARLLRERGLFRLYRLVNEYVGVDDQGNLVSLDDPAMVNRVPAFMTRINPLTDSPFTKQEEFIGWFCEEAHVSRGLVFMRLAAIERMLALNFTLEHAFQLVVAKPFAVQETLTSVADWDKGELIGIRPEVARQLAKKIDPGSQEHIGLLAEKAGESQEAMDEYKEAVKPLLAGLVEEVALHDRSKDALEFVRHEILMQPEITYAWDNDANALIVTLLQKQVDQETGEEYMGQSIVVPFVPDALELPKEIRDDLVKRLPIRNRYNLDLS
jgi:hypothetical protein